MLTRKNPDKGLKRIWSAVGFAIDGLKSAFRNEAAFRQELVLFSILCPVALYLGDTSVEKVLLVGSIVLILLVELINSAIEAVVDRISLERHTLSKRAKDIGASLVLIAFANALFTWLVILAF